MMNVLSKVRALALGSLGCILCVSCSPSSPGDGQASPGGVQIGTEGVGEIVATIDGAAYRGETLEVASEGTSTAEFMAMGPMTMLNIQAHDPTADSMMENLLSIDITLTGSDASASVSDVSMSYWPEGMGAPFFVNESNKAETELIVESLSLEDGAASIAGRFTAKLCRKAEAFSEADPGNCVDAEGTIETALLRGS